jgi:hypothetical protein
MKINHLIPAFAAALGLALASAPVTVKAQTSTASVTTAPASTTTAKASKEKSGKTQYTGSITAIDASSVTVQTSKETLALAIDAKTKFRLNGGKGKKTRSTASAFAVGDKVTGSYSKDASGAMTAASVDKAAPPAAPAAK